MNKLRLQSEMQYKISSMHNRAGQIPKLFPFLLFLYLPTAMHGECAYILKIAVSSLKIFFRCHYSHFLKSTIFVVFIATYITKTVRFHKLERAVIDLIHHIRA